MHVPTVTATPDYHSTSTCILVVRYNQMAHPLFQTVIETKEERTARGHPVGHDVPYAAMGGITGFSSLMDGYMRLDDSGIGPPPLHVLEQPVGKSSNLLLEDIYVIAHIWL